MTEPIRFHDHRHALDFDQRAARSDIRAGLGAHLIEAMDLKGSETVLDIATGTGRFAGPVSDRLKTGKIIGLDEAQAMLKVGREKPISRYLQTAGDAQAVPFRDGVFDCAFVAFSLHHFAHPSLMVKETRRVLRSGGRFFVLDPVFLDPRDSLDRSLNDVINGVFQRSHGANFRFHSASEIRELLAREGLHIGAADLHSYAFDQDGMEGIPTGRHWLEVVQELQRGPEELKKRFETNYFECEQRGGEPHVKGSFSYALVRGDRR